MLQLSACRRPSSGRWSDAVVVVCAIRKPTRSMKSSRLMPPTVCWLVCTVLLLRIGCNRNTSRVVPLVVQVAVRPCCAVLCCAARRCSNDCRWVAAALSATVPASHSLSLHSNDGGSFVFPLCSYPHLLRARCRVSQVVHHVCFEALRRCALCYLCMILHRRVVPLVRRATIVASSHYCKLTTATQPSGSQTHNRRHCRCHCRRVGVTTCKLVIDDGKMGLMSYDSQSCMSHAASCMSES